MNTSARPLGLLATAFASVFALLLVAALAFVPRADAMSDDYDVWVNGVRITRYNADDVFAGAPDLGKVSFTYNVSEDTGDLYLEDARIFYSDNADFDGNSAAIWAEDMNLTIHLKGKNRIINHSSIGEVAGFANGIFIDGTDCNLEIVGDGTLEIDSPNATTGADEVWEFYGICVNDGDLTVADGANIIVTQNSAPNTFNYTIGVEADTLLVKEASLFVELDITTAGSTAINTHGPVWINADSTVAARSGSVVLPEVGTLDWGSSYGIYAHGDIVIDGKVTASSSTAGYESSALYAWEGSVIIEEYAKVDAFSNTSPESDGTACAIHADEIDMYGSSVLTAAGYHGALSTEPYLMMHTKGGAYVGNTPYGLDAEPWDGTSPLGGAGAYRYVSIPGCPVVERIAGDYANETAALISKATFEGVPTVVIARDDDFADALGATGLAGELRCPILLTDRFELSDVARSEIERLDAAYAFIIGGPGAIKDQVQTDLEGMGLIVERIYGENSYDTSLACAEMIEQFAGPGSYAIIAMSTNFQDALSMSPIAYSLGMPLILQTWGDTSEDRGFTEEARAFLQGKSLLVAGGPGAISDSSLAGLTVEKRLYGNTGYETSYEIAMWAVNEAGVLKPEYAVVACGAQPPKGTDALAGSALAGLLRAPILLMNGNTAMEPYDVSTSDYYLAHKNDIRYVYVLGGTYVVPPDLYKLIVEDLDAMSLSSL